MPGSTWPQNPKKHVSSGSRWTITKDEEIEGLGDEAGLLRTESNGTEVTYHWRRGNLVVEAHLHCFGYCPPDVDAAARGWVDA